MNQQHDPAQADPSECAEALRELVSAALELREAGRGDWLDAACAQRPDLREAVRTLVRRADRLPGLLSDAAESDPMLGRELGTRFRLIERLGAGAMGVVYLAEDTELGRRVACKVIRPGLMPPEQAIERFEREARSMAAIQHPAVVAIHDRGRTADDQVYLVMEYLDGTPMSALLDFAKQRGAAAALDDSAWVEQRFDIARRGESSWLRVAVCWIADLARGLEAVHRAGVLHRDIKPSNIHVRRTGQPALLDFGIALLDDAQTITRAATSLGTPAYLPPEALVREARRTPASDVYSLAATLYHLITLRPPYEGTPTQVLAALSTRDPKPASELRAGLPRDLQAILDKGMHRRPGDRYASAAELEADLLAFLEFRPVSARPITKVERLARRLVRSRAALGAAVAVVTVGVVAGVALGADAWRERELAERRAHHMELRRHYPPNLGIVDKANRVQRFESDKAEIARLLDEGARVAIEPLPTLLLRATFRADHGDPRGAAEDMADVASFVDTPYAHALAERYAAGGSDIDLDGLPAPALPVERYLHAYHLMRAKRSTEASAILAEPEVRAIPHAEELGLVSTSFDGLSIPKRRGLALELYADLVRLEERIGGRTAMTAHVAGRLLVGQGRHQEAWDACREGLELAPRSYVLHINAGYCAFVLRRLPEARQHLLAALEQRPNYAKIVQDLLWVEIADGRFDEALRLVREYGPQLNPRTEAWEDYWTAVVSVHSALAAHDRGDESAKGRDLERAHGSFSRVRETTHVEGKPVNANFRITEALSSSNDAALVLALADLARAEPDNWWRQRLLLQHMPTDLDAPSTQAIRGILEAHGEGVAIPGRR